MFQNLRAPANRKCAYALHSAREGGVARGRYLELGGVSDVFLILPSYAGCVGSQSFARARIAFKPITEAHGDRRVRGRSPYDDSSEQDVETRSSDDAVGVVRAASGLAISDQLDQQG